jgi:hypothetical protein
MTLGNAISLAKLLAFVGIIGGAYYLGYKHEHARRLTERAAVVQATQVATQAQIALNEALAAKYRERASNADRNHQTALAAANNAAARYVAAHRLPDRSCAPSGADPVPAADIAGGGDGAGVEAIMVAVSADDVAICSANTARLEAVRQWGVAIQGR